MSMEFNSFAELIQALGKYDKKNIDDPRLTKDNSGKISIKQTGQCEVTDADGGYLVAGKIVESIGRTLAQKSSIYARSKKFISAKGNRSNSAWMPYLYETNRTETQNQFHCYWVEEGEEKTESKFQFDIHKKPLHKLFAVVSVTDELWEDSMALQQALEQWIASTENGSLVWYIEQAMLYGNWGTSMEGIFSAGATGVIGVATANPLDEASLENYVKALAPSCMDDAIWIMSKENFNDVLDITFNNDNVVEFKEGRMYLYGFPVYVMEQMYSPCDICLGSWSHYGVATKEGGIESAISIHVKFLTDEKTLRFGIRINGASFGSVFALEDTTSVAPFVIPEGCAAVESSSSSEVERSTSSVSSLSSSSRSSASSASSDSSSSNSSASSDSSSSDSSTSESSTSSSESQEGTCAEVYCAAQFATASLNGTYLMNGTYNSNPAYKNVNGLFWIWYDSVTGYWAISGNKGDPQNQWESSINTVQTCPDGDSWVSEDGAVTAGYC